MAVAFRCYKKELAFSALRYYSNYIDNATGANNMNAHLYAYLKQQAISVMRGTFHMTRDEQRAHIIGAVRQFPEHNRRFIASCAWSMLGYGGGF